MASIKIRITGIGFLGERKSLISKITVPDYEVITGRTSPDINFPMPDLSIEAQQREYIDANYIKLVSSFAHRRDFDQCAGYELVAPNNNPNLKKRQVRRKQLQAHKKRDAAANLGAKVHEVMAFLLLAADGKMDEKLINDFQAILQVMWPDLYDLPVEKIVNIVLVTLKITVSANVFRMESLVSDKATLDLSE